MLPIRFPASVCPSVRPAARSFVRSSVRLCHDTVDESHTAWRRRSRWTLLPCVFIRPSVRPSLRWSLTLMRFKPLQFYKHFLSAEGWSCVANGRRKVYVSIAVNTVPSRSSLRYICGFLRFSAVLEPHWPECSVAGEPRLEPHKCERDITPT